MSDRDRYENTISWVLPSVAVKPLGILHCQSPHFFVTYCELQNYMMKFSAFLLLITFGVATADSVTIKKVVDIENALNPNLFGIGLDVNGITFDPPKLTAGESITIDIWFSHCVKVLSANTEFIDFVFDGATPNVLNPVFPPQFVGHISDWEWEFLMTSGDIEDSKYSPDEFEGANRYLQTGINWGRLQAFIIPGFKADPGVATFCGIKLTVTVPDTVTTYWDPSTFEFEYTATTMELGALTGKIWDDPHFALWR